MGKKRYHLSEALQLAKQNKKICINVDCIDYNMNNVSLEKATTRCVEICGYKISQDCEADLVDLLEEYITTGNTINRPSGIFVNTGYRIFNDRNTKSLAILLYSYYNPDVLRGLVSGTFESVDISTYSGVGSTIMDNVFIGCKADTLNIRNIVLSENAIRSIHRIRNVNIHLEQTELLDITATNLHLSSRSNLSITVTGNFSKLSMNITGDATIQSSSMNYLKFDGKKFTVTNSPSLNTLLMVPRAKYYLDKESRSGVENIQIMGKYKHVNINLFPNLKSYERGILSGKEDLTFIKTLNVKLSDMTFNHAEQFRGLEYLENLYIKSRYMYSIVDFMTNILNQTGSIRKINAIPGLDIDKYPSVEFIGDNSKHNMRARRRNRRMEELLTQ